MFNWVTSDQHFGHFNIIRYCNRPYRDVSHMNEMLIEAFNAVVDDCDTTLHVGDFSLGLSQQKVRDIVEQLNGDQYIIRGNHDISTSKLRACGFLGVYDQLIWSQGGIQYIACHDPANAVSAPKHILLHGHLHGMKYDGPARWARCQDVGVDGHGYLPLRLLVN